MKKDNIIESEFHIAHDVTEEKKKRKQELKIEGEDEKKTRR